MSIAIAGGGIAGLAAAIALANAGRHVTVYEQGQAFTELGAGLQVGPNGVRALKELGAWDAFEPAAVALRRIVIADGANGRLLAEVALGEAVIERYGAPYVVAHRADLLAALLETAKRREIELSTGIRVADVRCEDAGLTVSLEPGGQRRHDALIGADGLHSLVRARLHGGAAPAYPGHIMYRALLPTGLAPAEMAADAVSLWLCPGGHVVHYPVSGKRMNLVAFAESGFDEASWNAPAERSEVLAAFRHAAPPLQRVLDAAGSWHKWPAADRTPLTRWGKGAVTLIGDAAHPALPYLAQGAVMALEDAVVLGRSAAERESLPKAFRAYESARRARTARLQHLSRRQGRIDHLSGPMRLARNAVLRALPPGLLLRRLDWLYSWRPEG